MKHPKEVVIRVFNVDVDPRRKQEFRDSQFIQEDHKAIANLPETEINREWQRHVAHPSATWSDVVYNDEYGF